MTERGVAHRCIEQLLEPRRQLPHCVADDLRQEQPETLDFPAAQGGGGCIDCCRTSAFSAALVEAVGLPVGGLTDAVPMGDIRIVLAESSIKWTCDETFASIARTAAPSEADVIRTVALRRLGKALSRVLV